MSTAPFEFISAPAARALANAGYTSVAEAATASDAELLALHGFGRTGLRKLRERAARERDPGKEVLHRYLRSQREAMLFKLDGLPEHELRMPRTPTGTSLLGLLKHVSAVELDYFGVVFDRPSGHPQQWSADSAAANGSLHATAEETVADIYRLHEVATAHADATIEALELDAPGRVPWWRPEGADVTLHQVLVHVTTEIARHVGHADILRELHDGAVGLRAGLSNLPGWSAEQWAEERARLTAIAEATRPTTDGAIPPRP